jgi:hypothetical protein
LAAAARRSAAAMSGRRCSSTDGTPTGTRGWVERHLSRRQAEARGRLADQGGDGVLVERALGGGVGKLGLGRRQLGLGPADIEAGRRAAAVANLGQVEGPLVGVTVSVRSWV